MHLFTRSTRTPERPVQRIIFDGDLVQVGQFHCAPQHDLFRKDNRACGYLIVFPRSSVYITHTGRKQVVATSNVVIFYNKDQTYQREKLSEVGDVCEYFGFSQQVLLETMQAYDPWVMDRPYAPFLFTHGPSDADSYLRQRLLVKQILDPTKPVEPLYVQEQALTLLERAVARVLPDRQTEANTPATRRAHAELAHAVKSLLATRFHESLSLADIAATLYTSPYHLCRVFRQEVGQTIHHYRTQMRLRVALDYVLDSDVDLATLALSLGYANHSHFTQAFRAAFHATPSTLRSDRETIQRRRNDTGKMSKNLTV